MRDLCRLRGLLWLVLPLAAAWGQSPSAPAAPRAQRLQVARLESTWLVLQWSGPPGSYEVSYRQQGWPRDRWVSSAPVAGLAYSLVGLRPQTYYDLRVTYLHPQTREETKPPSPAAPSPLLTVETAPWQPRVVGALRLWPPLHFGSFADSQTTPRLVTWAKSLYVIEGHEGGVFLSKVQLAGLTAEWTRPLALAPPAPGQTLEVRAAAVLGDHLYVLVGQSSPGSPEGKRETLYSYGLPDAKPEGEPLVLADAAEGGLQVYRERLWVMWRSPDALGVPRVCLAPLEEGKVGEPSVWQDAPSASLHDLALGVSADELLVLFSDEGGAPRRRGYAPLSVVQFNGASFHGLRKIADLGRNTDASGAGLGPAFYLFHGTDAPWASCGGCFRDLCLSTLLPDQQGVETITYLDDMKYNRSCSAVALAGSLYLVHEKLEYEPAASAPPPPSYGTFISRVDLGAPAPASTR